VLFDLSEIAPKNKAERIKYAVSTDRVIGITVNGESRAYPLKLMNVHEVSNDTLGGVPIAVTYSPLCDSAVIFNRT
jgi:phosphatidate phosphatase APP1